jgi:hypothetical protein
MIECTVSPSFAEETAARVAVDLLPRREPRLLLLFNRRVTYGGVILDDL